MNQSEQIHHARMLLNAHRAEAQSTEEQLMHFIRIGPKAIQKLEDERLLLTEDELHEEFVADKYDIDTAVDGFAEWLDETHCGVGDKFIHRTDLIALSDVVFDLSLDFIGKSVQPSSIVGYLEAFISKHELESSLSQINNNQTKKRTLI
jgi:hypothetical protein